MPNEQLELSLPYFEIKTLANRDYLRKRFTITSKTAYMIPFNEIKLRQGFIKRTEFEVEELAELLITESQKTPFDLDVLPDGTVYLFRGRRRYAAYMLLIEQGRFKPETPVPFFPTEKTVTELDRMVDQITYNHHTKDYTPLEQSAVCFDIKNNFGKISNEEIATRLGMSRQKVDMLLLIADASDDIKDQIKQKTMGITEAADLIRKTKKAAKQTDKVEEDSHKNSGTATPFPKDELAGDVKELAELEKEETPEERDQRLLREQTKRDQEHEQLLEVSDEINVKPKTILDHVGRKLSAPALRTWTEDFIDETNGEVVTIERNEAIAAKNEVITAEVAHSLLEAGIKSIFVYRKGMEPIAQSVITEPVAEKEKDKWDLSRPEMEKIQKAIQAGDKIEAIVSKLDVPEQVKTDIAYQVHWLVENLIFVRDWVHTNKKQNKSR